MTVEGEALRERQAGAYDCRWGLDTVRVLVAGQLPPDARNAPLHLFSASPELASFGQGAYWRRSEDRSLLLGQLSERFRKEGFAMAYTMEDFKRDYIKEHFAQLTPEEQREALVGRGLGGLGGGLGRAWCQFIFWGKWCRGKW